MAFYSPLLSAKEAYGPEPSLDRQHIGGGGDIYTLTFKERGVRGKMAPLEFTR